MATTISPRSVRAALREECNPQKLAARLAGMFGSDNVQLVEPWDSEFWVRLPSGRFCQIKSGRLQRTPDGYRHTWNVRGFLDMVKLAA